MLRRFTLLIFVLWTTEIAFADVQLFVDANDGAMEISGDGERLVGILIASEAGAIATDGDDVFESADPFTFIFTATPTEFHIRNDSQFITLEGNVEISPRFDVMAERDLEFFFDPQAGFVAGAVVYVPEPEPIVGVLIAVLSLSLLFRRRRTRTCVNSG